MKYLFLFLIIFVSCKKDEIHPQKMVTFENDYNTPVHIFSNGESIYLPSKVDYNRQLDLQFDFPQTEDSILTSDVYYKIFMDGKLSLSVFHQEGEFNRFPNHMTIYSR